MARDNASLNIDFVQKMYLYYLNVFYHNNRFTHIISKTACLTDILAGKVQLVFASPEAILEDPWKPMIRGETWASKLCLVVCDEAHCIHDWYVVLNQIPKYYIF